MKIYTIDSKCKKCGLTNAATKYTSQINNTLTVEYESGLLLRECKNCTYRWFEKPLDNLEKPVCKVISLREKK